MITSQRYIKSTCGICFNNCGVLVKIENGKVSDIYGDPECHINQGSLCIKGRASLEYLYHPSRLKFPLKRVGDKGNGKWQRISWNEALDIISYKLQKIKTDIGPHSVAFIDGSAKGLQDAVLRRFAYSFGTPNIASTDHICFVPRRTGSIYTYGFSTSIDYDFPPSCIIVWAANVAETRIGDSIKLSKSLEKGSKLIVIDPKKTELAQKADIWLQPRPGSDLALALGMIHVIIKENLYDKNFIQNWTVGFDELCSHIEQYAPEKVAELTWVPANLITDAARLYANNRPAGIQLGNPIDHNINSFQTARAVSILRAITGNIGCPGGELEKSSVKMLDYFSNEITLKNKITPDVWAKRIGNKHDFLNTGDYILPQHLINAILEDKPYPINMVYIQACNPLLTYSNATRVYEALYKVPFLVIADLFMTPTASLADIILPVSSYLEFNSIVAPPYYSTIQVQQKVTQVGECRSDFEILNSLAKRMDISKNFWDSENQFLDEVLKPIGITFNEFCKIGIISAPKQYRLYKTSGFPTSSGKVELFSSRLMERGFDPLPIYRELPMTPYNNPEMFKEFSLIFTSRKVSSYRHSGGRQISTLRGYHPDPTTFVHKEVATKLGINDNDWIYIETPYGKIKQQAKLTDDIDPRVIYIDYGWWFPEKGPEESYGWKESNINVITSDEPPFSPEMGSSHLRGTLCKIYKA